MRRRSFPRTTDLDGRILATVLALVTISGAGARADNAVVPDLPSQTGLRGAIDAGLRLEVFVNGRSSQQIVEFLRAGEGRFEAKREDLREAGLALGAGGGADMIRLDAVPGLAYRYDEPSQSMYFTVPDSLVAPHVYNLAQTSAVSAKATSAIGAALNYDAFATTTAWGVGNRLAFGGASLSLDGRVFSPWGVVSQSGVLGATLLSDRQALRLDTTWEYGDEDRRMIYRAGDFINSGLAWTRPIRMGGLQITHDFTTRPDLITGATATATGTATVPTSVDAYVNNLRVFSGNVDAGPFRIENLPSVGGAGTTTLVLHDVTGKEVTETNPFFVSARLLTPGTYNYSAEAGYARTYYGAQSFSYAPGLVESASLRGGLTDFATVEAHAEGGDGLRNGGAGVALNVLNRGVFEAALAGSQYQGGAGGQLALGVSTAFLGATLDFRSQRTFRSYADLAEITTPNAGQNAILSNLALQIGPNATPTSPLLLATSVAPPKALDQFTLAIPAAGRPFATNFTFVNQVESGGATSRIASVGISRGFKNGASVFAQAFVDFANHRDAGVLFGLSWSFDNGINASSQANLERSGSSVTTQVSKTLGDQIGSVGWSVADNEGANRYDQASFSYLSGVGRATVSATEAGAGPRSQAQGSVDFSGAIAALDAAVKLAPRIPDSLALVDAGAPGVTVLEDNREIGKTDSSGQLLLTGLRGFQDNKITIDATTLPLSAQTGVTETNVRPRAKSGVVADFKVVVDARDAEIILVDAQGAPLPPGSQIDRDRGDAAVVGYEGRAYLTGLSAHNSIVVHAHGEACEAQFDFEPPKGKARPTIGPVTCRAKPAEAAK